MVYKEHITYNKPKPKNYTQPKLNGNKHSLHKKTKSLR